MNIVNSKEPVVLLIGDFLFLTVSLWVTLCLRYLAFPDYEMWIEHFGPFSILFVVWMFIFYVAGLYERHNLILKNSLPLTLLKTQIANVIVAITFFYFIAYFSITPKVFLFMYIFISFGFIFIWRIFGFYILSKYFFAGNKKQNAVIFGDDSDTNRLMEEINNNDLYGFEIIGNVTNEYLQKIDPAKFEIDFRQNVVSNKISLIIFDLHDQNLSKYLNKMYNGIFLDVSFVDKNKLYESIFGQVSMLNINHGWFLANISNKRNLKYDSVKRVIDFLAALIIGIFSLIVYPFVYMAIKLNDGGQIFYFDDRVGKNNKKIRLIKFRSMSTATNAKDRTVTKVGKILRKTRIDELPQIWNVLKGELSIIGPRPEQIELTNLYKEQIDFYDVRNIVSPGLSGWAQLKQENHPHHSADVSATKEKLSYDLYYIKNRSFWLDLKIALQTLKVLISQKGR